IRKKLKIELKDLKNIEIEKQIIFKKNNDKEKEFISKKNELLEEKQKLIFNNEYEIFKFINDISNENNLTIEVIGREVKVVKNLDNTEGTFFYHATGREIDIFNFILQLDEEKRYIALKSDSIMIEINNNVLDLKMNVMYIFNNKKENFDYDYYNDGTFKNYRTREIGKKRRSI
ncbi:MAG: hypothetical protein ACRC2Q_10030, partial [Cetobacterium sp.]